MKEEHLLTPALTASLPNLLLTDDHQFLQAFVQSAEAEAVLMHLSSTTLEVAHPVHLESAHCRRADSWHVSTYLQYYLTTKCSTYSRVDKVLFSLLVLCVCLSCQIDFGTKIAKKVIFDQKG